MKIYIGTDHVGFELKEELVPFLEGLGFEVEDKGAFTRDPEDDYPDYIFPVAEAVAREPKSRGVVIGYSGQAEAMASNRLAGVRASVYYGEATPLRSAEKAGEVVDIITATREDNDSNVLSIGAGFVSADQAKKVLKRWLETPFLCEERHMRRITKLDNFRKRS